jgi:hypothetical protein
MLTEPRRVRSDSKEGGERGGEGGGGGQEGEGGGGGIRQAFPIIPILTNFQLVPTRYIQPNVRGL